MHSEFREGLDGGSPLLGEFAEQHFASWPNSIRLAAPQGGRAVSHPQPLGANARLFPGTKTLRPDPGLLLEVLFPL